MADLNSIYCPNCRSYSALSKRAEFKKREFVYGIPSEIKELDEEDKKILKEISENARINIVDLAEKTKLTRDIVSYRLKKLIKEGIIAGFSFYPNLDKISLNLYKMILRIKNFDQESERQVKSFVSSHKKANQMLKLIGSWDLEIEFEIENEDELYKILNELRKRFSNIIRDYDILRITETYKLNFFPF